ncbi:hypothetical protein OROGR_025488 [Orobanche gracilis]
MKTRSMARNSDDWEREEMRIQLELAEALAKKHEEQIAEITARFNNIRNLDRDGGSTLAVLSGDGERAAAEARNSGLLW